MIVEYIRYRIPTEQGEEFEAAYARAAEALQASQNCLDFELTRCHEEPERYVLRIRWDSLDGHLRGFRQSPEFRTFFGHIRPYVGNIEEMQHYELTAVVGSGAAARTSA